MQRCPCKTKNVAQRNTNILMISEILDSATARMSINIYSCKKISS